MEFFFILFTNPNTPHIPYYNTCELSHSVDYHQIWRTCTRLLPQYMDFFYLNRLPYVDYLILWITSNYALPTQIIWIATLYELHTQGRRWLLNSGGGRDAKKIPNIFFR